MLESNHKQAKFDISQYISQWKYEIADNLFQNKNHELVAKLITGLQNFPISQYKVLQNNYTAYSWSQGKNPPHCLYPTSNNLTLRGLHLGKINTCISKAKIIKSTLTSSLFIFITTLASVLIIIAAFFPLLGYKKSLISTLDVLKKWNKDPKMTLNISYQDNITNKLISLVRQGIYSRIELKEIHTALNAEKELSKITKQVAHDIRSPVMSLNIALHESNSDISEPASSIIKSSINRILETSDDLLKNNRKNRYRLNKIQPLLVRPLILDVINDKIVLYKNINFNMDVANDLEAICSPTELKRVLSNLLNNSIEAIIPSSGTIDCKVQEKEDALTLSITDNGCGISEQDLPHIFDEDFTSGKESGNGLGLYYAHRKIKEWGGTINAQSTLNKGTCFEIHLKSPKT